MICQTCGGFVAREPATITCLLCGRWGVVLDADYTSRVAQRVRDFILRPRSAECSPEHNVPRPLGWRPGTLRLPGATTTRVAGRGARHTA